MLDLDVIDTAETAIAALEPTRARMLAELAEPGSATTVAAALGLPRQQVNYHLRTLESHGLVTLVEERPRRGLVERVMQATAHGYVVAPPGIGATEPGATRPDRLSSRYLIAVAARAVREVGNLARRADQAGRSLPTLTIDSDIRFATAADRAAFTQELAATVNALASRYHNESAPNGRWHRLVVGAYPRPATKETS